MEEIRFDPIERKEFFLAKLGGQEVTPPDAVTRIERYLQDIIDGNASTIPPITRIEYYLAKISGADVEVPDPVTRIEYYLAKIAGMDVEPPDLITRLDYFLAQWVETGGGVLETVTGNAPITLADALAKDIVSLTQYGFCDQADTPTPTSPVDILCNNGALQLVDDELPAGYKRVLGFRCNNNAMWEITGFKLRGSDTVKISFSVTAACNVFGCYQSTSATDNYDLYATTTSGGKYFRYANGTYASYFSSENQDKRFDVTYTPTGSFGMPEDSTWTEATFESANDLLLGSTTVGGTSSKLKGNLYGDFIVENGGVERLHVVPCERVSDNVLGYYDLVGETFYEPYEGYSGAVSLGYDGSHYVLQTVGTPEVLTVTDEDSNTQTASVENLLGIGDNVDEQEIISGSVKRTFAVKVFNGTETFSNKDQYGRSSIALNPAPAEQLVRKLPCMCTHYEALWHGETVTGRTNICYFYNNGFYVHYEEADVTEFKAFLKAQYDAGTPVILVYKVTEATESVTAQPLTTAEGTNTVSVTAEVSTIELEAKYTKSAA